MAENKPVKSRLIQFHRRCLFQDKCRPSSNHTVSPIMIMTRVKVNVARRFVPHSMLLSAAQRAMEASETEGDGCWYDWLGVILYCSLSIEAIGNTYGETFVTRWKDFESSSPLAKMRIVAEHCGLKPDFSSHPWAIVPQLGRFRNLIAHAKLEEIKRESIHPVKGHEKHLYAKPNSKLENMVTKAFAQESMNSIYDMLLLFEAHLPTWKVMELEMGGWHRGATLIEGD